MDENVAVLEYIVLLVLLGFIVGKIYGVLGRRTGHERQEPFTVRRNIEGTGGGAEAEGKAAPMARPASPPAPDEDDDFAAQPAPDTPLARGLMDIQLADRTFEPIDFLRGAKGAYEMIVCAYAAGERKILRPLVDADVMQGFDDAISAREANEETMDFTFIGFTAADITEAELIDRVAEVTVKFVSEVISVKKNSDGAIIEGDPNQVVRVTDHWTFARDTRSSDPNWELVATEA